MAVLEAAFPSFGNLLHKQGEGIFSTDAAVVNSVI